MDEQQAQRHRDDISHVMEDMGDGQQPQPANRNSTGDNWRQEPGSENCSVQWLKDQLSKKDFLIKDLRAQLDKFQQVVFIGSSSGTGPGGSNNDGTGAYNIPPPQHRTTRLLGISAEPSLSTSGDGHLHNADQTAAQDGDDFLDDVDGNHDLDAGLDVGPSGHEAGVDDQEKKKRTRKIYPTDQS